MASFATFDPTKRGKVCHFSRDRPLEPALQRRRQKYFAAAKSPALPRIPAALRPGLAAMGAGTRDGRGRLPIPAWSSFLQEDGLVGSVHGSKHDVGLTPAPPEGSSAGARPDRASSSTCPTITFVKPIFLRGMGIWLAQKELDRTPCLYRSRPHGCRRDTGAALSAASDRASRSHGVMIPICRNAGVG